MALSQKFSSTLGGGPPPPIVELRAKELTILILPGSGQMLCVFGQLLAADLQTINRWPTHPTIRGRSRGGIPPVKPTILNFITILYNSGNSIGDIRSFCRPVFCHSSVVEYTSSLLQQWTSNETCLKYITETPLPQPYWLVPILPAAMITAVWITQLAGLQYHVFSQYTQESLFHYIYH